MTAQFLYDGDRLVGEYNGSGALTQRYVHGAGVDEPLVWYQGAGTTARNWLSADHQGSIIAAGDATGAAVYSYGPYGEPNAWSTTSSRFSYTGQIALPEVALYYYKARDYDPVLGRFLQTDPVGYKDDNNLYTYVGNDPVDENDPSGKWIWIPIGAAIGFGVDIAVQHYVEHRDLNHINWVRAGIAAGAGALSGGLGTVAGAIGSQGVRLAVVGTGSALIGGSQAAATDAAEGKPVTTGDVMKGAAWSAGLGFGGQSLVEGAGALTSTKGLTLGHENIANSVVDTTASTGLYQGQEAPAAQTGANIISNLISNAPNTSSAPQQPQKALEACGKGAVTPGVCSGK